MAIWRRFWVQEWPKLAQNSLKWPKTTPKMVRNDVGTVLKKSILGVILGSFWGHFGSFWAQKMTKRCLQKMTPNHPRGPKNGSKLHFFSFCMENTHFYEFCHHGFQNRLKTSVLTKIDPFWLKSKPKLCSFTWYSRLVSHSFTENTTFHQTSSKIENREIPV